MNHYLAVLKKYAVFSGRAQRAEYWYFVLFNILITIGLSLIDGMIRSALGTAFSFLALIYSLGIFVPSLAVAVRRLHDTGKSAWMLLINIIPIIGPLWFLVLMIIDSNPGNNKYGANPKGMQASK